MFLYYIILIFPIFFLANLELGTIPPPIRKKIIKKIQKNLLQFLCFVFLYNSDRARAVAFILWRNSTTAFSLTLARGFRQQHKIFLWKTTQLAFKYSRICVCFICLRWLCGICFLFLLLSFFPLLCTLWQPRGATLRCWSYFPAMYTRLS